MLFQEDLRIKKEWAVNNFKNEEQFQSEGIMMILKEFPPLRDKVWHTTNEIAIPKNENESDAQYEKRCLFYRGRLKSFGVSAGVPDILILLNGILYKIELKQPKGVLTDSQKKLHPIWNTDCPRIPVVVCRTLLEVYYACKEILKNRYNINFNQVTWEDVGNHFKDFLEETGQVTYNFMSFLMTHYEPPCKKLV